MESLAIRIQQPPVASPNNTVKKYIPLTAGTLITLTGTAAAIMLFTGATTIGSIALPHIAAIGIPLGLIIMSSGFTYLRAENQAIEAIHLEAPLTPIRAGAAAPPPNENSLYSAASSSSTATLKSCDTPSLIPRAATATTFVLRSLPLPPRVAGITTSPPDENSLYSAAGSSSAATLKSCDTPSLTPSAATAAKSLLSLPLSTPRSAGAARPPLDENSLHSAVPIRSLAAGIALPSSPSSTPRSSGVPSLLTPSSTISPSK